jgi:predicted Rossmann fold nucleotide-binding protein DprA/Smf involved in DNA uptake
VGKSSPPRLHRRAIKIRKMTERTNAILLFTAYFAKGPDGQDRPLSLAEWNKFVRWLQSKNLNPEDFFTKDPSNLLSDWNDLHISKSRLYTLLARKTALALALDKWARAGVWVLTRGDAAYPQKLKQKLNALAPNVLFGIGDQQLMEKSYVAVVGSRNAGDTELLLARKIARDVCQQGKRGRFGRGKRY